MSKNINFEEKIARIQEIAEHLEESTLPLNELIELYEEGMKLSIECREYLDKAELKVETITAEYFSAKDDKE